MNLFLYSTLRLLCEMIKNCKVTTIIKKLSLKIEVKDINKATTYFGNTNITTKTLHTRKVSNKNRTFQFCNTF